MTEGFLKVSDLLEPFTETTWRDEPSWSWIEVSPLHGVSRLSSCKSVSPLKILNPRALSDCCQVVLSNYGGGFVAGDKIHFKIECKPHSKLYLGTQAETKIYKSFEEKISTQRIVGELHPHAFAVVCPDALIPYKGSRFFQRQCWHLEGTATLILIDWLHAGRSALGEDFQCEGLSSEVEIVMNGKKLLLDKLRVQPEFSSPFRVGAFGRYKSYFNLYLVGEMSLPLVEAIAKFPLEGKKENLFCALNRVNSTCHVLRALAAERQDLFPLLTKIFGVLERPEFLGFNPLLRKH